MFKRITIAYSIINNRNRGVIPNIAPKLFSKRYFTKDMSQRKVAVIVGAGPGLGNSCARKFASQGYAVALVARSADKLKVLEDEINKSGAQAISVAADATKEADVKKAFDQIKAWGNIEVLVYNAGSFKMASLGDVSSEEFEQHWRINCLGGFNASHQVLADMAKQGHGTIIFTGATASLRGGSKFALLAVGKFGLRALAQSMAKEYGPQGVHVVHAIIDGMIDTDRVRGMVGDKPDFVSPEVIADTYWYLHSQPKQGWVHEIDIRSGSEKW
jgi:NAD(P)-dependent dehydrogenase (short-subunit alcohol dehydrogenase family)